jgi:hypothetical protein
MPPVSVDPPGLDLPAALLAATFPEGPPRRLVQVLGTPDRRAMTRFKAAPIIAGRPRFFVADTGEPVAWAARVEAAWPGASAFLSRAPVGTPRSTWTISRTSTTTSPRPEGCRPWPCAWTWPADGSRP